MPEAASHVTALEVNFPFEELTPLAQLESWRKEVNRPVYHIHKWWANRLGSVFRAILLAAGMEPGGDLWQEFYRGGQDCSSRQDFGSRVVLDPFMGSGTTIGEALKLGYQAVGVDINPVSYFQVRKALEFCDEGELCAAFHRLEERAAPLIRRFYTSSYQGEEAAILYTFWVKLIRCPSCGEQTRLFNRWLFSANAYPSRKQHALAVCPDCGAIVETEYSSRTAACLECSLSFDPQSGPVEGQWMTCEHCGTRDRIIEAVRKMGSVPSHEMYALMLHLPDGRKVYKRPDESDYGTYALATGALLQSKLPIPRVEIPAGHNTNQARGYNYRYWHEMFNDRQLYSLGTLLQEILQEEDQNCRECLLLLFSGVLEFNNMFCSFKGEGTGAVRHLFHHHILKPERTPLEANPWGTQKSSGAFSTLFERRLLNAKRYCAAPFELRVTHRNGKIAGEKVYGLSKPLRPKLASHFSEITEGKAEALLLCADASQLPIPDNSVDLVVTDPPYFDNVHYSELADFFYCWLKLGLGSSDAAFRLSSSRNLREVQGRDPQEFAKMLGGVFQECARVLKPEGLLAFTFHHSREEAWLSVAQALQIAGMRVVAAHPVKAEMAVAVPKLQAREPINLDLVIVCRHHQKGSIPSERECPEMLSQKAATMIRRYNASGVRLSRGDVRVVLMGQFLRACSDSNKIAGEKERKELMDSLTQEMERLYLQQEEAPLVQEELSLTSPTLSLKFLD